MEEIEPEGPDVPEWVKGAAVKMGETMEKFEPPAPLPCCNIPDIPGEMEGSGTSPKELTGFGELSRKKRQGKS